MTDGNKKDIDKLAELSEVFNKGKDHENKIKIILDNGNNKGPIKPNGSHINQSSSKGR